MKAIGYLLENLIRLCAGIVKLLLEFTQTQPFLAVLALGVLLFAILSALIPFFWLLMLGVVLVGIGGRMRQQENRRATG